MRMSHVEIEVKYHSGRETRNLTEHCICRTVGTSIWDWWIEYVGKLSMCRMIKFRHFLWDKKIFEKELQSVLKGWLKSQVKNLSKIQYEIDAGLWAENSNEDWQEEIIWDIFMNCKEYYFAFF